MIKLSQMFNVKNEHYFKRYEKLLTYYFGYEGIGEKHHILPKSLFPNLRYCKENLVNVPFRVHYLLHYLLAKSLDSKEMWWAFNSMCNKNTASGKLLKINSILYQKGKTAFSNSHSEWHAERDNNGLSNSQKIGQKTRDTKMSIPGYYADITRRSAQTMKETIQENGLTIAQNRSINAAKKVKEQGLLLGINNPNSNIICVYNNNDELIYTFFGDFLSLGRNLNLPVSALKNSYRNGGGKIFSKGILSRNKHFNNFKGWYAVKLGLIKEVTVSDLIKAY